MSKAPVTANNAPCLTDKDGSGSLKDLAKRLEGAGVEGTLSLDFDSRLSLDFTFESDRHDKA